MTAEPKPDAAMAAYIAKTNARSLIGWNVRKLLNRPKLHCTWCGQKVPGRRRTWCSDECTAAWAVRAWPSVARYQVENRDKGVCAICQIDTEQIKRIMTRLAYGANTEVFQGTWDTDYKKVPWPGWERRRDRYELGRVLVGCWLGRVLRFGLYHEFPHLWEMDHIIPVIEGGGACGLNGLRTLCLPCHHRESAKLAARRARKKRSPEV